MEVNFFKIKKSNYSLLTVVFLATLIILPILSLFIGSIGIDISNFLYLSEYLLLDYTISTVYLLSLTLVFSLMFGVIPAWLISTSRFRGRRIYDLLLYFPLAIPTYIMAFSYGDILSFSGPFQSFVRDFIPSLTNFVNQDYLQIEILDNNNKSHIGGTAISVGNPHVIFFVSDLEKFNIEKIGPTIENHELFPERCNVTIGQVINEKLIKVKVWERGAGLTKACGTAACATAFAGLIHNISSNQVDIEFKTGNLTISIDQDNFIKMKGPVSDIKKIDIKL